MFSCCCCFLLGKRSSAAGSRFYKVARIRSSGVSGNDAVYKVRERTTGRYLACKTVSNRYIAQREVYILKAVRGSRLQNFFDVVQRNGKTHILSDYIPGMDLFDTLTTMNKNKLTSRQRNTIIREMASCIRQIHDNNFAHLDIKLENFIALETQPIQLKLIDYATCHPLFLNKMKLQVGVGSRGYTAPEAHNGYYHVNSDIWSFGVCIWCITTGVMPFGSSDKADYTFPTCTHLLYRSHFTALQFKILRRMFKRKPECRLTIEEFQKTPWDSKSETS